MVISLSIHSLEEKQIEQQSQIDKIRSRMSDSDDEHAEILKTMLEMKSEIISEIHSIRKENMLSEIASREYLSKRMREQSDICSKNFISAPSANAHAIVKTGLVLALFALFVAVGLNIISIDPSVLSLLIK